MAPAAAHEYVYCRLKEDKLQAFLAVSRASDKLSKDVENLINPVAGAVDHIAPHVDSIEALKIQLKASNDADTILHAEGTSFAAPFLSTDGWACIRNGIQRCNVMPYASFSPLLSPAVHMSPSPQVTA